MKYIGLYFLIFVLLLIIFFPTIHEGFTFDSTLDDYGAVYPKTPRAKSTVLLGDSYPILYETNHVSDKQYNNIWWKYPIFPISSFKQYTNNLKYFKNPDNGTAIGAEFSNAFYGDNLCCKSNVVVPLPQVHGPGKRIGYYLTDTILS
jgi:hypothetical protein